VHGAPPQLGIQAAAGFGYVSLVATAAAYLAWFTGLRQLPASSVGLIGLLNPVTGVLLGTLLAAESLGLQSILGMGLVLGGVLLGLANGSRRKPLPEPELPSRDAPAGQAVKGC